MYLRFVVKEINEDSGRELGVFHAIRYVRDEGKLSADQLEQCESIMQWFSEHLERPTRFTAAKPPYYRKQNKAISWFKDTAHAHLGQIWELVGILQQHGVEVRMLRAERVGYVVYEDEFQIVAEPFSDTP